MKTIQCAHPPHHHNGFVATYQLCGDEEDGCIELSSRLHYISITLSALCLLSTLLVLTLTMREFRHWPSIAGMSSRHVATKPLWWWEGWVHWIFFMTSPYKYAYIYKYICVCVYIYIYMYVCVFVCVCVCVYIYI